MNEFENIKPKQVKLLEDGKYKGTIIGIVRDNSRYDYMRYEIKLEGLEQSLKVSYPTDITFVDNKTPSSSHAKFLSRLGFDFTKNYIDLVPELNGVKVSFLVQNVEKENGTYAEIVKDSVKKA